MTQLDSTVEEVSLQDIHLRKAFRSSTAFDQQVVARVTIPTAMADTYQQCDRPPPLDKLNVYRSVFSTATFAPYPKWACEIWSVPSQARAKYVPYPNHCQIRSVYEARAKFGPNLT